VRSGRLLAILLALQERGRVTASALAHELEVSERTIHRDMESLSMAGVPVYAERGPRGGWCLPANYRSGPRGLDADELRALFLSAPGTVLGDLGLDRASESALTKLLLAVPPPARSDLSQTRQKLLVDLSTWRGVDVEPTPCLATLYDALSSERQVAVRYMRADGVAVERQLNPLGLVAKGQVWYLVASVADADEPRTYRVSRAASVQVCEAASHVPPDFDLRAFWDASKARLVSGVPRFRVCLRAAAAVVGDLERAGRWSRIVAVSEPCDAEGWVRVEMEFELEEDACALALSYGARVELLAPAALRSRVASELAAALGRYAGC
jgi:predicted DNA-binding transcriptional regulator YafY